MCVLFCFMQFNFNVLDVCWYICMCRCYYACVLYVCLHMNDQTGELFTSVSLLIFYHFFHFNRIKKKNTINFATILTDCIIVFFFYYFYCVLRNLMLLYFVVLMKPKWIYNMHSHRRKTKLIQ